MRGMPSEIAASRTRSVSATLASYIAGRSDAAMPMVYVPARWMTASQPDMAARMVVSERRSPTMTWVPSASRSAALDASRTTATTWSPRSRRRRTVAPPMNPAPPVTKTLRLTVDERAWRSVDRRLRPDPLEPGLDRPQERCRLRAVVRAVVDGEDHVHDRPDRDDVALGGLAHDGSLGDGLHGQDCDLGDIDDRHGQVRAEPARVVDGQRAPAVVVELELAGAGARGDLRDSPVQATDREPVDVANDRHEEPVVDGDGDAHVDPSLGEQTGIGPLGVEGWIAPQRVDHRLDHERDVAERDALASLVVAFGGLPGADQRGGIDLHMDVGV